MNANTHNLENEGSKPRDHVHPRQPLWRRAHRDWRVWVAVTLMLALVLVYVMTNNLSLRPGGPPREPTPAANVP